MSEDKEGLDQEELDEEEAELLPEREEMSFVDLDGTGGLSPPAPIVPGDPDW